MFVASSKGSDTRPRINEAARAEVLGRGTRDVPTTRAYLNLAKRLESHGESYFRFLTTPGIEPTNNLAEQAIRFVVIDRRITQGTRSQRGDRWCERIWTVMATCGQQGRSVFAYLESAVTAWFHGAESPTLLPSESRSRERQQTGRALRCKVREDREVSRSTAVASVPLAAQGRSCAGVEQGEDRCRNGRCALVGEWTGARRTQCAITTLLTDLHRELQHASTEGYCMTYTEYQPEASARVPLPYRNGIAASLTDASG